MTHNRIRRLFSAPLAVCAVFPALVGADEAVRFNRDIRPVLSDKCFRCHGPDAGTREADLRLDVRESAVADRDGSAAITPGDLDQSVLWQRIIATDPDERMPPPDSHKELTGEEVELFRRWIEQGAEYQGHWAFLPPVKTDPPGVEETRFRANPVDAFLERRRQDAGLPAAPRAAREILIRRITLDLTGLPPTLEEIDAFVRDDSPGAWERVVDRLLASERYGERMALDWLDAARYGDTSVFHADGPRDMWVWRDWVIEAFNRNLPYNDFTVHQLAGDLLPDPTWRQLVATGFNRNNASTDEGGAIAEEYRIEYAVDRVKTTSMVWLGLSLECAQCHEHKYDPIPQKDYYRFFAYFNQAADPGMQTRRGNQSPLTEVPDETDLALVPDVERELADAQALQTAIRDDAEPRFQKWVQAAAAAPARQGDLPDDMVAWFPLNATEGRKVRDAATKKRNGTVRGKPVWEKGRILNAVRTDGKTWVDGGNVGDFERTDKFSWGCWFYANGRAVGAPLARMDDANAHRGFDIHLSDQAVEAHLIHKWQDNAIKVSAPAKLKPKTWHHVFVTYDGSSRAAGVQLYLDGKLLKSAPVVDQLSATIRTTRPLTLGRRTSGSPFNGMIDDARLFARQLSAEEVARLAAMDTIGPLLAVAADQRTDEQTETLRTHYLAEHDGPFRKAAATVARIEKRLAELRLPLSTVMVMKDVPQMRPTWVLKRGQYDAPDKEQPVTPGVPSFLPPPPPGTPANRLGMARWLVDPANPLTARVAVNRYWRLFFGTGIVKTVEEFGAQGDWPSHPELLDWLAVDFVENGWDVKRLIRMFVTSEAYCQSSRSTSEQLAIDPQNRLLSRGPRFRLQGEFVRDQALAISGLLVPTVGGPGVKPYQPPGLWNEVSLNRGLRFSQDHGDKLYRRSMYIYWKRSAPHPVMTIFDAPTREKCTVRRSTTNTPLQALVLLNDPQFLEASRFFAERILREGGNSFDDRLTWALRVATARAPADRTRQVLTKIYTEEHARFSSEIARAEKLLAIGEKGRDQNLDAAEHAAWTILASLILNLDETMTRG